MTTLQLPAGFKTINGYRFSLRWFKASAAQGTSTMAYKSQIRKGWRLDNLLLNYEDILLLEEYFSAIGVTGDYQVTRSGNWVRCINKLSVDQLLGLRDFLKGK